MRAGWTYPAILASLAVAASPAAARPGPSSFQLTSVTLSFLPRDIGRKGASKGDTITYRDNLLNVKARFGKKKGAVVGSDRGTMLFTSAHTATFTGQAKLPGGTLTLKGRVTALADGGLSIPVPRGSGRFAEAHGTLTVGPGRDHVLNTYRLAFSPLPVA